MEDFYCTFDDGALCYREAFVLAATKEEALLKFKQKFKLSNYLTEFFGCINVKDIERVQ